jgi:protein ImuB
MGRIVSVWLPDWPITVWSKAAARTRPEGEGRAPFALVERTTRGLLLSAVNAEARTLGLHRGQAHADARAIAPHLESAPAEPEKDAAALQKLALWAERFSPCVALDQLTAGFEGLYLDMTGGAHLFGGEGALLQEIERRLKAAGVPARAAVADTPGAAWALARFSDIRIAPEGRMREALAGLPAEALRVGEATLKLLRRFGLKRIGDVMDLPRAGLARRFRSEEGLELVRRLDQALGLQAEPFEPVRAAPIYRTWRVFAEPLIDVEGIGFALPALAEALAVQLERDGKGARRVQLTAFRVDGRTTFIEAGLSAPAASATHLLRLLKEKGLERLDLGFGVDALMLSAGKAERVLSRQTDLERERTGAGENALAALIDRIEARIGEGAVLAPALCDSHIPERSEAWRKADPASPVLELADGASPRPLFLFDPPEPIEAIAELPDSAPVRFVWRRVARKVSRSEGPERLSPEWWRSSPAQRGRGTAEGGGGGASASRTRDYYRVEDEDGRRYWLYREGLYGREDNENAPSWWLHGVFA